MQFWLAYVDAVDTAFDPVLHCTADDAAFAFELIQNEGEVATIEVTREQSGWGIVAPGAKRCAILSESPTGDPADAFVIARGRITGLPTDLHALEQTITIECSEWDVFQVRDRGQTRQDGRLMRYCREHLQQGPATCWVLDDNDPDDANAYLSGRAEHFYYDPATFEISTSHLVDGARLVNLSDAAFFDDEVPPVSVVEWPTTRYRMQLRAEWTQQARGFTDVAWLMGSVDTLSPDFLQTQAGQLPDGLMDMRFGTGWTLDSSDVAVEEIGDSPRILDGRAGNVTYQGVPSDGPPVDATVMHKVWVTFQMWRYRFRKVLMRYEYEQQRIETIDLSLDVPIQGVPTVQIEEDLGEVGTVDLINESYDGTLYPTMPWEPRHYDAGERVTHNGYSYECLIGHDSYVFFQRLPGEPAWPTDGVPRDWTPHPYWKMVDSLAPLQMHSADFAGSSVGQGVIAHCMMRLRKRAIERIRCVEIELTYILDETTTDITVRDRVRVEMPWPDGTTRAVVGKVIGTRKRWDAEEGGTMTLTLGVSVGTGGTEGTTSDHRAPYGTAPNYLWSYVKPDLEEPVYGIEGDTEYLVDADKLRDPVDVRQLGNAGYAVLGTVIKLNQAGKQIHAADTAGQARRNPAKAVQRMPTNVHLQFRDLGSDVPFERWIFVSGEMLRTDMGIDLTGGDDL